MQRHPKSTGPKEKRALKATAHVNTSGGKCVAADGCRAACRARGGGRSRVAGESGRCERFKQSNEGECKTRERGRRSFRLRPNLHLPWRIRINPLLAALLHFNTRIDLLKQSFHHAKLPKPLSYQRASLEDHKVAKPPHQGPPGVARKIPIRKKKLHILNNFRPFLNNSGTFSQISWLSNAGNKTTCTKMDTLSLETGPKDELHASHMVLCSCPEIKLSSA